MSARTGKPYDAGELEVILLSAPTRQNIHWLAILLKREEAAIELVYRIAFGYGPFAKGAAAQQRRISEAKARVEVAIGRKRPPTA